MTNNTTDHKVTPESFLNPVTDDNCPVDLDLDTGYWTIDDKEFVSLPSLKHYIKTGEYLLLTNAGDEFYCPHCESNLAVDCRELSRFMTDHSWARVDCPVCKEEVEITYNLSVYAEE